MNEVFEKAETQSQDTCESIDLGLQSGYLPSPSITQFEAKPIVKPHRPSLPKLECGGHDPKRAPLFGAGNLRHVGKALLKFCESLLKNILRLHRLRLITRPSSQLSTPRAPGMVRI